MKLINPLLSLNHTLIHACDSSNILIQLLSLGKHANDPAAPSGVEFGMAFLLQVLRHGIHKVEEPRKLADGIVCYGIGLRWIETVEGLVPL
jgi:hypothetical protein